MNMNNIIKVFFSLLILSIEVGKSLNLMDRYAQSSVLVDKRIYFFGGFSFRFKTTLDQLIYLDVSKPFNIANPPFEEIPNLSIPFGSSFATALLDSQKKTIYLFGGVMVDVNGKDNFASILYSYDLETNEWYIPRTNGIVPVRRREINGVISNETGKFYIFGGSTDQVLGGASNKVFNDMNIFNTVSLIWSKGSTTNASLPRQDYTATLLSNGFIVFIGGREEYMVDAEYREVDISQLSLYDTKSDKWSLMTTRGTTLENRFGHSAVLTPDERIIVFGGERIAGPIISQPALLVLNTKTYPYEWSIPPAVAATNLATIPPPALSRHSSTLIGNYMLVTFGNNSYPVQDSQAKIPFFYILDIRNFTWVTQFEPSPTTDPTSSSTNITSPTSPASSSPAGLDNGQKIGIIVGVVGFGVAIGTIAGFLGYRFYKRQKYNRAIPTAGGNESARP